MGNGFYRISIKFGGYVMKNETDYFGSYREVYIVDTGILLAPSDTMFAQYAGVYDKKFGYYDESQEYDTTLADAISTATNEVESGVVGTYAVVSVSSRNFGDLEDNEIMQASVEDETFSREQVVYSLVKISKDLIVPNFVGTYLPSTLTKETVEALCDYCATMQLGIVGNLYTPYGSRNYEYKNTFINPFTIEFLLKPKMYKHMKELFRGSEDCTNLSEWINICCLLNSEDIEYHEAMLIRNILIKHNILLKEMSRFKWRV